MTNTYLTLTRPMRIFFQDAKEKAKALVDFTLRPLMDAGAQHIVLVDVPTIGDGPFVTMNQPKERSIFTARAVVTFNNELNLILNGDEYTNVILHHIASAKDLEMIGLQTESPCTIGFVGIKGADPVISPLNGGTAFPAIWDTTCLLPDAPGFAFWDELHPTAAAHELISGQIIDQICIELHPGKDGKPSKGPKIHKTSKRSKTSKKTKKAR